MKILVPCIPFDGGRSGISVYIREVVRALRAEGHSVTCVFEGEPPDEDWVSNPVSIPKRGALFSMLYHLFALPRRVKRLKCDCCILPAANRRMFWKCPLPTVAVVHDLSQYHVEAKYDVFRMFYVKRLLPFFVRRATSVVAISKSTAKDLVQFWKIPEKKISVVYDGFTPVAGRAGVPPPAAPVVAGRAVAPATAASAGRAGAPAPAAPAASTILYLSRLEHPGKNHVNLIRAYERLPEALAKAHPLVLAGGDWNGAAAVRAAAEASPRRDLIRFTGFVGNERLAALWADAAAYVFPSRFEGFGLSLLEAMSAGIPCACSATSSLGELGEGVAELFDPEDVDAIAAALEKILTAPDAARVAAGRERAAAFTWRRCALGLLAAFPPAEVFGVPIDCTTEDAAVAKLIAAAKGASAGADGGKARTEAGARLFAFVNAHCLNIAYVNGRYRDVLRGAAAVWPDGTGVRMAGAKLGFPVPANVNGTDLFPLICRAAEKDGVSVFFYGARDWVVAKMAENVRRDYPRLRIAGFCDGYQDDAAALAAIREAKPDLLFVAKGVPGQELWIADHQKELACNAAIAVGGLFDFVSGRIPRAPAWMRRWGVEWVFRLYQEPVRLFRRYVIGNPLFMWRLSA